MVIVNSSIWSRINEFYSNVETKYHNTWDIDDTIAQINKIEWVVNNFEFVCSWCREPIIQRWKQMGWKETWYKKVPWHFAFERKRIDGIDYIYSFKMQNTKTT